MAKALRVPIRKVFGPLDVLQRCQVHKRRNILDHLPKLLQAVEHITSLRRTGSGSVCKDKRFLPPHLGEIDYVLWHYGRVIGESV